MKERITAEEYAAAISLLVKVAQTPSHSGRAAAEVLLSTYNGFEFQADLAGLSSLDGKNFSLALAVIQGRYDTGREPHMMVGNGNEIFRSLWAQWFRLHVDERAKVDCRHCDGYGMIYHDDNDDEKKEIRPSCKGKKKVTKCCGQ